MQEPIDYITSRGESHGVAGRCFIRRLSSFHSVYDVAPCLCGIVAESRFPGLQVFVHPRTGNGAVCKPWEQERGNAGQGHTGRVGTSSLLAGMDAGQVHPGCSGGDYGCAAEGGRTKDREAGGAGLDGLRRVPANGLVECRRGVYPLWIEGKDMTTREWPILNSMEKYRAMEYWLRRDYADRWVIVDETGVVGACETFHEASAHALNKGVDYYLRVVIRRVDAGKDQSTAPEDAPGVATVPVE